MAKTSAGMTEAEIQAAQQAAPVAAPESQTITDQMAIQFLFDGRQRLTALASAMRQLREWADTFEQRGGADTFGNDALSIVFFNNDIQAIIDATKRATISRLRTDI